ncbi:MAG: glucosamine-6-phosphate isomerase [Oscillospiraceae bacterium]|nr:glucosamine-6-phosphate isomerase [Oscillospiraceae bacterium]
MSYEYYHIPPQQLGEGASLPLVKLGDSGEVFYELASLMCREIRENNAANRRTLMICPVGPVGQYPIFVRLVNQERLSLKNVCFFNMDEYLTDEDEWIAEDSPLSFRGFMNRQVYTRIDPALVMPPEQRIFPDPKAPGRLSALLEELGGADLCVGGIGITGHLAFNEPQPELTAEAFAALTTRVLDIAPETRATNAAGDLGGALEAMPRRAVTIGMKEILSAKKLRLAVFRDWHRAVCRRAAYGDVTSDFPATLAQTHPDAVLYVNATAAQAPF